MEHPNMNQEIPKEHLRIIRERMELVNSGKAISRPWSEIRKKYLGKE